MTLPRPPQMHGLQGEFVLGLNESSTSTIRHMINAGSGSIIRIRILPRPLCTRMCEGFLLCALCGTLGFYSCLPDSPYSHGDWKPERESEEDREDEIWRNKETLRWMQEYCLLGPRFPGDPRRNRDIGIRYCSYARNYVEAGTADDGSSQVLSPGREEEQEAGSQMTTDYMPDDDFPTKFVVHTICYDVLFTRVVRKEIQLKSQKAPIITIQDIPDVAAFLYHTLTPLHHVFYGDLISIQTFKIDYLGDYNTRMLCTCDNSPTCHKQPWYFSNPVSIAALSAYFANMPRINLPTQASEQPRARPNLHDPFMSLSPELLHRILSNLPFSAIAKLASVSSIFSNLIFEANIPEKRPGRNAVAFRFSYGFLPGPGSRLGEVV